MRGRPPMIDVTFVPAVVGAPDWAAHVLDPEEFARWSGLHSSGRPLFLAAHIAARCLVARRVVWATDPPAVGLDIDAFGWAIDPSGKPRVTFRDGRPQPLHVSVSHGGSMAVAAVCEHGPIGVDVEHVESRRNLLAIAKRFYSTGEYEQLAGCDDDARAVLFHQWWTRKEAVLKATGDGLRGGLAVGVDGPPDRDGWRRVELAGRAAPLFVRDLSPPEAGVLAAVAIEGQPGTVHSVGTWLDPAQSAG